MKKLFSIIVLGTALMGCSSTSFEVEGTVNSDEAQFTILRIGKCQYLYRKLDRGCMFSHSGECDNTLHIPVKICGDSITYITMQPVKHTK